MDLMDLAAATDDLYGIGPEEFVSRRAERVKEARQAGDRTLAKAIGELRKPTKSAWLVNLLARDSAGDLQALLDLGTALTEASRQLSGPDIRRLSADRNAAVHGLSRRAAELAADHGESATEANRQEVAQTLQAALADPGVAEAVRAGVLTRTTSYGGFGPIDLFAGTPVEPATSPDEPATAPDDPGETGADAAELEQAQTEVAEARVAHQQAEDAASAAEAGAQKAASLADQLAAQLADLRSQLDEVASSERQARERAQSAEDELRASRATLAETEQTVTETERALGSLPR